MNNCKHYFLLYHRHFGKFANTDLIFIAIGCGEGGSLQRWKRFFGPHARIAGSDINPACRELAEYEIEIRIGDQSDAAIRDMIAQEFGAPHAILDDGSHPMSHIQAALAALYPKVD